MFCLLITREDSAHIAQLIMEAARTAKLPLLSLLLHGDVGH